VLAGLKKNGKLLVNTDQDQLAFAGEHANVYKLNASAIAVAEIGRDIPNVPILGALIKIAELAELPSFQTDLQKYLNHGLPEKIVDGNLKAFARGYNEVTKL
jgi:pyruvate ferredoxin oxidoreductase gamma subunit